MTRIYSALHFVVRIDGSLSMHDLVDGPRATFYRETFDNLPETLKASDFSTPSRAFGSRSAGDEGRSLYYLRQDAHRGDNQRIRFPPPTYGPL